MLKIGNLEMSEEIRLLLSMGRRQDSGCPCISGALWEAVSLFDTRHLGQWGKWSSMALALCFCRDPGKPLHMAPS